MCQKRLGTTALNLDHKPEAVILNPNHKLLNTNKLSLRIVLVTWSLQPIVFKWRQNSPSTGFASWSRIDTTKDERTVKFFSPSPVLIRYNWIRPVLIRKIFQNHQSDPVLIRQCKIMYFYFASWGKISTRAIFLFANYDWLKAKYFQQCLCLMRQNRHRLSAFPKFNTKMSIRHQRRKHCWSYFAIWRVQLLGLVKWQGRYTWISVRSLLHDLKP